MLLLSLPMDSFDFPAVGWLDGWKDADIFLRTHLQLFRIQQDHPGGCRVTFTVVSHSICLLTMSIGVLFFFSCLKGYGFVSHRWPAGFGCVLGINLVIGYDLAGIIFHSIKVPAELFFLIVTCITIVSVSQHSWGSEDSLWQSVLPPCGSERLNTIALQVWQPAPSPTQPSSQPRVLSCGIVSVCLLLLPALWVSSKKSSPDPMS